ncbi:MAG: TonB-dependent receptor [Bacteroidales bacterium]|nr:TonB-dependent receptor [Bacteroidales bacterium]
MNCKQLVLLLTLLLPGHLILFAQEKAIVYGTITNNNGQPIELVNVAVVDGNAGTSTDSTGYYELKLPAGKKITIAYSYTGYKKTFEHLTLKPGEKQQIDKVMVTSATMLPDVIVEDRKVRNKSIIRINPKSATIIPSIAGSSIESLVKTMPGVSSRNELSSQYSVRGGNFDENLVYVNGIEIYRPFLIRAGRQEGLSFLNSDLVSSVLFSAGGFDAKYGDKMSSVLDITYKKPAEFKASAAMSLLGGSLHVEDATNNGRFSYLLGVRQKSNQYILESLQTEGEYRPSFSDVQSLLRYELTPKLEISALGYYGRNHYELVPENRETDFGTLNQALRLKVYFDGKEVDEFNTYMGALSASYRPYDELELRLTSSAYQSLETETYDVQGQYWIGRLETDFGDDEFGEVVQNQGVGTYLDHARNDLNVRVFNLAHKGSLETEKNYWQWGLKYQHELIDDDVREWNLIDSAGYTLPRPTDSIGYNNPAAQPDHKLRLNDFVQADVNLESNRVTGYFQNTFELNGEYNKYNLTAGVRAHYWDLNNQLVVSPRATVSYKPNWEKDVLFRFSAGYYYQPPFYRELRDKEGNVNTDLKAQKSIHFVMGSDWNFLAWNRPFKFVTEVYYKHLDNLIPYEIDNVRIRYQAENRAHGYSTGIDMKVNGEFVKGVESWASLSIMQTQEDIKDDFYWEYITEGGETVQASARSNYSIVDSNRVEPGYIPRPTDQRISFSLFFQDYLPNNPTYKMHLNLVYGSSLPFGPPDSPKYKHTLRIPAYRRVDIGFSKMLLGEQSNWKPDNFLKHFESLWISAEVFNLLQINNTISYIWVTDVANRKYAVPNYLTPRQLNVKLIARF